MYAVETTITEHVFNQGWIEGEAKGKTEGKAEGKAEGKIEGEAKGEVEGRKKTAINLLKMEVDMKTISQATGFSKEEIKQLIGS